ncbi:hypothetical protein COT82_02695 [Candidatus Campbellbacteria bacterium CG10_big_fil_rev_8_21_14_0_10_35_52]|uniref:Transcriptional regulator n=1 Tax=Candidatus Campbellbacteria bacterium CG10_big_fil_rev_8_21_14_0_10_35_52 TaxID=1974527 RepID=A0A2M6WUQ9_9BACT|nr:MAG: hypothetical protein COT82_02695 [Candidatus Campbellbacteria bacterium CG10_big_fil_rev_8_21_14_0_10_35_52]
MKILGKLFGSPAMVKLLRLFLFNPENVFTNKEAASRAKITLDTTRLEFSIMKQMNFIKKKIGYRQVTVKKGKKKVVKKKKIDGWTLNENFMYINQLKDFLIRATPIKDKDIPKKLSVAGIIKFIAISGIFIQDMDSRLDILIVGNNIRKLQMETIIRAIESELGKELKYVVFDVNEFKYRINVHDKLIRDVFDYPHKIILNKLGIEVK